MTDAGQDVARNVGQDQALKNLNGIRYGWCHTDHKAGLEIRPKFRQVDYIQDEKYAASVAAMLKKMGLPQPDIQQVFRGTHHDLLFLDDHGVVVRIGPTKVNDLIHPAIIQPLGWLDDEENEITVAIYPGVELMNDMGDTNYATMKLSTLRSGLQRAGHGVGDVVRDNAGVVHVDRGGVDMPIAILLDPDSEWNGALSTGGFGDSLSRIRASVNNGSARPNKSEILDEAITSISALAQDMRGWEAFFKSHQPLRTRFWLSQKGREDEDTPEPEYMKMFWDECHSLKQKPKNYIQHKYTPYVNEHGVSVYRYSRHEILNAALVSPWTKKEGDQHVKRHVAPHKQKMLNEIAADASVFAGQHEFYKGNIRFVLQALNSNPACYQYLTEEQKDLPEVNSFRLNRTYFTSENAAEILQEMREGALQDDEVQRNILNLFELNDIEVEDIPSSLRTNPDFALKALPNLEYSFKRLVHEANFVAEREFILKAVRVHPDIAEIFIDEFQQDIDLMWDCVRENPAGYDTMLKYIIGEYLDEIPDDLRANVDFVNRYVEACDFKSYVILSYVAPSIIDDKKFRRFILENLKSNPSVTRAIPERLMEDHAYMSEVLRAEPKVFFFLPEEMQRNEALARTALYADYKRKTGVCNHIDNQLLDDLYDGGDKKFRAYFFGLCANMGDVFNNLPSKYTQNKAFILNVLDYGTTNYYQFSEAMRSERDITKKAILANIDNGCEDIVCYVPAALGMDEEFVKELLAEDERSYACFAEFILKTPAYMPDMLCEDAELLYTLVELLDQGDMPFMTLMALDDSILNKETKAALSCQLAYHGRWRVDVLPAVYLEGDDHVVELLEIDADIYHLLPEHVKARKAVMETALLNDGSYAATVIESIPKDVLGDLSVWDDEDYLKRLSDAVARNKSIYALLPSALTDDKNFTTALVTGNSDLYKDLPYHMKAEKDVICAGLMHSSMNVLAVVSDVTSSLDRVLYNDLEVWFDASLQKRIQVKLQEAPANFWILPECLQENAPFLCTALERNVKIFGRLNPSQQREPEILLKYFDVIGSMPKAQRPGKAAFIPNDLHHDKDFMSDVFARLGFDHGYLPEVLSKDKAFFDQAVLKSPKLLDDDDFMIYFNAAQYQRSLEDMADPEKWFNNHLVDAFNEDLRSALDARAQKYDHIVKREDGLCYEWVANVCLNKVKEQGDQILYNYAGQENAEPLVYDQAIIADPFDTHKPSIEGRVGIYKRVHDKL
tara:strand:- start:218912 stop:222628 length:3717 start_codon:yes stop_codon:yes gene_type:complete